jgi:alkylmercury lyase
MDTRRKNRDPDTAMSTIERLLELIDTPKTADEKAICKVAFDAILGGRSIDHAGLVAATRLTQDRVTTLLTGLITQGLVVIEPDCGRIVGSWGLSLVPTDHRLRIRERELYTWCAMDAVGIPAGLREDASVASACYQCGSAVNVEFVAGEVTRAKPAQLQLWLTPCQAGRSVVGFT